MNIHGVKVANVGTCGGSFMVAEAEFEFLGRTLFATASEYDGTQLTVSEASVYDFMTDETNIPVEKFVKEYECWEAAQCKSEGDIAKVFIMLERVMNAFDMEEHDA